MAVSWRTANGDTQSKMYFFTVFAMTLFCKIILETRAFLSFLV